MTDYARKDLPDIKQEIMSQMPLDEYVDWFLRQKSHVMFNVTYYCESNCPHCHYSCVPKNKSKIMPETDVLHILSQLKADAEHVHDVTFSGGEITSVEDIKPGYIKRVVYKSLDYGFDTSVLTNGSFINTQKADRILNDIRDMYLHSFSKFDVRMSFDSYHRGCITNAHKSVHGLGTKMQNVKGIKYPFNLAGFNHEPEFLDNMTIQSYGGISVSKYPAWDLNAVGRAKTNDLPNCRDTGAEFEALCGGLDRMKLLLTPLVPVQDGFVMMMMFDCDGVVNLADAHNPDNFHRFRTSYKTDDGNFKSLTSIKIELANKLYGSVYGK